MSTEHISETKWAMKETDFGLIRIKRMDSFECGTQFIY